MDEWINGWTDGLMDEKNIREWCINNINRRKEGYLDA